MHSRGDGGEEGRDGGGGDCSEAQGGEAGAELATGKEEIESRFNEQGGAIGHGVFGVDPQAGGAGADGGVFSGDEKRVQRYKCQRGENFDQDVHEPAIGAAPE